MVRRGTTLKIAPHQPLSVGCPVRHCGTWLSVTWCKILDRNRCERMKRTENVEIRQKDGRAKDELISYLTFKRISAHDDGLYKCYLEAYEYESITHTINISVSGRQLFLSLVAKKTKHVLYVIYRMLFLSIAPIRHTPGGRIN